LENRILLSKKSIIYRKKIGQETITENSLDID